MSDYLDEMRRLADRARDMARSTARRVTMGTAASSTGTAQLQGDTDETWEATEVWSQFGLFTRAPVGSEAALLELDGNAEGAVVVATQNRSHRPSAGAGEVVLHGEKSSGTQVTLRLQDDRWILETNGATQARFTGYDSGKVLLEAGNGGTLTMDAGGTVTLESTAANPCHIGGSATSEKLIKGTSYNAGTTTQFGLIQGTFVSLAGYFTTIAAAHTANAAAWAALGPPYNAAQAPSVAAATAAGLVGTGFTAIGGFIGTWVTSLSTYLTTRAKGQ